MTRVFSWQNSISELQLLSTWLLGIVMCALHV